MSHPLHARLRIAASAAALVVVGTATQAAVVDVTVTVQNLAPSNGIAFAPLHAGFNTGTFDAFNIGGIATGPIISVAELTFGHAGHAELLWSAGALPPRIRIGYAIGPNSPQARAIHLPQWCPIGTT